MRIGIYDPYLDTLGGGERYVLSIASHLSKKNDVFIFWDDRSILHKAEKKLNLNLTNVKIADNVFTKKISYVQKIIETSKFDLIIYISDGSIPTLFAKKNILLFQFPVNWVEKKSFFNNIKLLRVDKIICYTNFVKQYLEKIFDKDIAVLYPPIPEDKTKNLKKENIILTVGRFTKAMNAKKQEILIEAFKNMIKNGFKSWKFVVVGSYLPSDKDFVEKITNESKDFPIEIITNASFDTLSKLYKKAKIYWHAAGYGEDLDLHPERAEHFGISTVEAMGGGAVPVVINAGGQKEIVEEGINGFLWDSLDVLIAKTEGLIRNEKKLETMSKKAMERAKDFSVEKFNKRIDLLISN